MNSQLFPLFYLLLLLSSGKAFLPNSQNSLTSSGNRKKRIGGVLAVSANIVDLGKSSFRDLFNGDKPVLIDACAKWCGPCKLIEPVLDRCADKRIDSLVVCRFDVESDSKDLKVELLLQGVMLEALPALILIDKKKVVATRNGLITDDELENFLDENLSKSAAVRRAGETTATSNSKSKGKETKGFINLQNQADDYMLSEY